MKLLSILISTFLVINTCYSDPHHDELLDDHQELQITDEQMESSLYNLMKQFLKIEEQQKQLEAAKTGIDFEFQLLQIAQEAIDEYGFHTHLDQMKTYDQPQAQIIKQYPRSMRYLKEFYFQLGYLSMYSVDGLSMEGELLDKFERSFFLLYTAASFNHKHARFMVAYLLENGIMPSFDVIQLALDEESEFYYLQFVSDLPRWYSESSKNLGVAEFDNIAKSEALIQLYLASLVGPSEEIFDLSEEEIEQLSSKEQIQYYENQQWRKREKVHAIGAQSALGHRFLYGLGVDESCAAAIKYLQQPAARTIEYIDRSYGMDSVERAKLNLMGSYTFKQEMQLDSSIPADIISSDILDLLDLQGEYGSAESLIYIGSMHMHGSLKVQRDMKKAMNHFKKALEVEPGHQKALYYLGQLNMYGLGTESGYPEIKTAYNYFKKCEDKSHHCKNALGVIYYQAPSPFETDPAKLNMYQGVYQDSKLSIQYLEKASADGNLHAKFNLGVLFLNPKLENFSFSKAYDQLKYAAQMGHTYAAYNVAIMNELGLGTYQSCQVASTFMQHVVHVGEPSQLLKKAFMLVNNGHYKEAAFLYLELAEQGFPVAQLNLALLLEKHQIFDQDRTMLGAIVKRTAMQNKSILPPAEQTLEMNKQIAYKYFELALLSKETEHDASLKLADFLYYGTSGVQDYDQAMQIYKMIEEQTIESEIRGQALFKLGMMYHFGNGVSADLDLSQIYYERALKEKSKATAPVYLMSLYSRWQRLDLIETAKNFIMDTAEQPYSYGGIALFVLSAYLLILFCTVKFLRKEFENNH